MKLILLFLLFFVNALQRQIEKVKIEFAQKFFFRSKSKNSSQKRPL